MMRIRVTPPSWARQPNAQGDVWSEVCRCRHPPGPSYSRVTIEGGCGRRNRLGAECFSHTAKCRIGGTKRNFEGLAATFSSHCRCFKSERQAGAESLCVSAF